MIAHWQQFSEQHSQVANGLGALLLAIVGYWLVRLLSRTIARLAERAGIDAILCSFLRNLVFVAGLLVVFIAALDLAGVPTGSLLAILGAAGLAIGLALKDSLSNIASGFMLILLRPFRTGDSVQIAQMEGIVERVMVFQTYLHTTDNRQIVLPNSLITAAPIVNLTALEKRRIDITFRIGHHEDLAQIRALCKQIVSEQQMVLNEPAHELLAIGLVDTLLELQWRVWVPSELHAQARSILLEALLDALHAANIALPAPKREMLMVSKEN